MPVRLVLLPLLCSGPSCPPHPLLGEIQLTFRSSAQKPAWLGRPDTVGVLTQLSRLPRVLMYPQGSWSLPRFSLAPVTAGEETGVHSVSKAPRESPSP